MLSYGAYPKTAFRRTNQATVREDYSYNGDAWNDFTFEDLRLRVYRWGEDGLAGVSDTHQLVCFSLAFWNENDDILKEKAFGLGGPQGNHGEDVKECYFYLDNVPTHSYMKYLYKYPHHKFPYEKLKEVNAKRTRQEREYELEDTGIFEDDNYFDIVFELAKDDEDPEVLNFRVTAYNRGDQPAPLHILPHITFRNTWSWNTVEEEGRAKPHLKKTSESSIEIDHWKFGRRSAVFAPLAGIARDVEPCLLFTENETNTKRLYDQPNKTPYVKDAFHDYVVEEDESAVNPDAEGTKACAWFAFDENGGIPPGDHVTVRYRFTPSASECEIDEEEFDELFGRKQDEADKFYWRVSPLPISPELRRVQRQAFAGLLWSKQYYHLIFDYWAHGDRDAEIKPPPNRANGRNKHWHHLYCDEVLSMPDKWEYPFFASWDTCFHTIPLTMIDPEFAKNQIEIFLKEWYQHPNGACPSYEWSFDDLNPPVFAWAAFRVYKMERKMWGRQDKEFLERVFHKLLLNFTWWINRKDSDGNNVFEGGFLGLDNIGIFNRSEPLPTGGVLEQADLTGWMAFYLLQMLNIALELAKERKVYEHIASKFFEHFLLIADAMTYNSDGESRSLWDEKDKFYYDAIKYPDGYKELLPVRSLVGLIPLYASLTIEPEWLDKFPGFKHRLDFLLERRLEIALRNIASTTERGIGERLLLALVNKDRLRAILDYMLDEDEFLSQYGIRSLSKYHEKHPYSKIVNGQEYRVAYLPGESDSGLFGGNSNWRGPIWFPVNFLLVESLQRFHLYYGNLFQVECPKGSGEMKNLAQVAEFIQHRLIRIFVPDSMNVRACNDLDNDLHNYDPNFKDYVQFFEYFDGDTGRGLGASHQCGWTALVAKFIHDVGVSCVTSTSPKTPRTIAAQFLDEDGLFKETASPFSSKLARRRLYRSSGNLLSSGYGLPTRDGMVPLTRRHTLHSADEDKEEPFSSMPPLSRRSTILTAQEESRDRDLVEQIRSAIEQYNLKREKGEDDVSSDELEAHFN